MKVFIFLLLVPLFFLLLPLPPITKTWLCKARPRYKYNGHFLTGYPVLPKDISTTVIEPPEKLAKIVPAEEIVLSLEDVESILEKSGEDLTQDVIENQICPLDDAVIFKLICIMWFENFHIFFLDYRMKMMG